MTNLKFISLIIFIGIVSIFAGMHFSKNVSIPDSSIETITFYNSTLKDIDNNNISLSKYKDKWLLINFWATWCAPCREEIPELNHLFKNNKNIFLLGVAIDEITSVKEFILKTPINYESLISNDIKGVEISKSLGNNKGVLPFTVLINPQGKINEVFYGKLDMESLNIFLNNTIK